MSIDIQFDLEHVWHPYTSMTNPLPAFPVESAEHVYLKLEDGTKLIDGMASWWSVIHGYNNQFINNQLKAQIDKVSHVMFGGLTHQPAIDLCKTLIDISPPGLDKVFLSDSGSVGVEVAIKMAIQYWHSLNKPKKNKLLSLEKGYHGDTFGAMSVCDPVTGMHTLFNGFMANNFFAPSPTTGFHETWEPSDVAHVENILKKNSDDIAALILEPIVQGAGGMKMYHPEFLKQCRMLCHQYDVLLIADEIATGFGRTGKMFACEYANITPDILCVGKALTGGYMSLAATLCTNNVATVISQGEAGVFMHGPTFMGNPLACAAANASLSLLLNSDWQSNIRRLEQGLIDNLTPLTRHKRVSDVRILGAIGVIEATAPVDMAKIQKRFVELGVWLRPFGKLIYMMPAYTMTLDELTTLCSAIAVVLDDDELFI